MMTVYVYAGFFMSQDANILILEKLLSSVLIQNRSQIDTRGLG